MSVGTYYASVNVSSFGIGGTGMYKTCISNGNSYSTTERSYSGNYTMATIVPTSGSMELISSCGDAPAEVKYSAVMDGSDSQVLLQNT